VIAERRNGMADESFALGAKLYAAKTKEFARRYAIKASPK
jgi:hypothetical protein